MRAHAGSVVAVLCLVAAGAATACGSGEDAGAPEVEIDHLPPRP